MSSRLDWVCVLNEQSRWGGREDLISWVNGMAGRPLHLLDGTVEGFEETLGYMRRSLDSLADGDQVDLVWLDTQLKTVTLGMVHGNGAQPADEGRLPRFRARVKGLHDTDLLRSIKDTLIVQFAEYIGNALDQPDAANVFNCEVCDLLFVGQSKTKVCSESCRFTALHSANSQPEVLPTEKRRYRRRGNA